MSVWLSTKHMRISHAFAPAFVVENPRHPQFLKISIFLHLPYELLLALSTEPFTFDCRFFLAHLARLACFFPRALYITTNLFELVCEMLKATTHAQRAENCIA